MREKKDGKKIPSVVQNLLIYYLREQFESMNHAFLFEIKQNYFSPNVNSLAQVLR